MTARLTTEEFIERAKVIHGEKYDYSLVEYINQNTYVTIRCLIHGIYKQKPSIHVRDKCGCPKCGNNYRPDQNEIIDRFKSIHGNRYNYSLVEYKRMHSKVIIICPIHGNFSQTPADHLWNHKCPECKSYNATYTWEEIYKLFLEKHSYYYTYDSSTYVNGREKMKILCPIHGEFLQKPEIHKNGAGCKKCTASGGPGKYCETIFNRKPKLKELPGYLYFLKLSDIDDTIFYKIGVTVNLQGRISDFLKQKNSELLWYKSNTLYECFLEEQKILLENKDFSYRPKLSMHGGKTECLKIEITE